MINLSQQVSKDRLEASVKIGNEYELELAPRLFEQLGWGYKQSSKEENMGDHFDYWCSKSDGSLVRVEVKAPKDLGTPGSVLLEYDNVQGGEGWLRGCADLIAQFLDKEIVVIYNREMALDYLLLDFGRPVDVLRGPKGRGQTNIWRGRRGRKDAYVCVNQSYIMGLPGSEVIRLKKEQ